MKIASVNAGAYGTARLVLDDPDRHELLRRLHEALRDTVLAYAILHTHVHAIAAGEGAPAAMARALARYVRAFRQRHGDGAFRLRGPVDVRWVADGFELGRAIRYVHANPLKTQPPLATRPVEHAFGSQRAFVGLCLAPHANVALALELPGLHAGSARCACPPLADLEPSYVPCGHPDLLLGAAAQTYGIDPLALRGWGREPRHVLARALYARLGALEGYRHGQLAAVLGRTRQRVTQLAATPVPAMALRIARTLLRDPGLRTALPSVPPPSPPRPRRARVGSGSGR